MTAEAAARAQTPVRHRYRYRAHGLRFVSDLALAGMPADAEPAPTDDEVAIRLGPLAALDDASPSIDRIRFRSSPDDFAFELPELVRYRVEGGKAIVVDHEPGVPEHRLEPFLAGTAIATICYRRGLLPLHASCIAHAAGAVAFLGCSGAGKSTLAADLAARGAAMLADDMSVVHLHAGAAPQIASGITRMKLCEDAALRLGHDPARLEREDETAGKCYVDVAPASAIFRPLRAIYLLVDYEGEAPPPTRLRGVEALHVLIEHAFRPELPRLLAIEASFVLLCAQLLRQIPLFTLPRRRGDAWIESEADRIDRHLRGSIGP